MSVRKKIILFVLLFFTNSINVYANNGINIFVSILPQQYFVEQVGGDHVDVSVMVGPGQNPATYEPTPQQMASLADADIYFSIGVPFERAWLNKIKAVNQKLIVVDCCQLLADLDGHIHHEEHQYDPHVWTNPNKVIQIVKLIEKSLKEVDISNSSIYEKSASVFIADLNNLDSAIRSKLSRLKKRNLIVSHPSWTYFANEYNLTQISIEQEGKEIQAKSMAKLIQMAKEKKVKAIFVQQQFNDKAAKVIAKEIDAIVFELDPLAYNYLENINEVTNKIVEGLSYE